MFIAGRATSLLLLLCLASCARDVVRASASIGSVAIDKDGNVYVAPGCAKWDADGRALQFPASRSDVIVADEDYLYCATPTQIRRFKLADGKSTAPIAIDSSIAALDVAGATLYVADTLGGRIRMFDTSTGAATGEFAVHLPHAVAVDPLGQIWVAHDHSVIQAFRADSYSGVTYGGLREVTSLSFGPGAKLYAADAASGQVLTLDTAASPAQFVPVLDLGTYRGRVCAVAADNHGNLVTLQRRTDTGGQRLAKYAADKKLLWERIDD